MDTIIKFPVLIFTAAVLALVTAIIAIFGVALTIIVSFFVILLSPIMVFEQNKDTRESWFHAPSSTFESTISTISTMWANWASALF